MNKFQVNQIATVLPTIRNRKGYIEGTPAERKIQDRFIGRSGTIIDIYNASFGGETLYVLTIGRREELFAESEITVS